MSDLVYEVSFKGVASPTLRTAFAGHEVRAAAGVTLVRCHKPALSGVMATIEDYGLVVLDVRLVVEHSTRRPHRTS